MSTELHEDNLALQRFDRFGRLKISKKVSVLCSMGLMPWLLIVFPKKPILDWPNELLCIESLRPAESRQWKTSKALDVIIGCVWGDSDVVDVLGTSVGFENGVTVFSKKILKRWKGMV